MRRASGANRELVSGDIAFAAQALGFGEPCPALNDDQRCAIHDDRKPVTCRVVPFDAWLPEELQHLVLASRAAEAHYLGSDCLTPGTRAGFPVVTRRLSVVESGARAALAERRRDLADEQRFWGRAVFQMLRAELLAPASRFLSLPAGGFLTLPLAPVLLVLASMSERCRERCIAFLDAQALLCERPHPSPERAAFARSNARLRDALSAAAPPPRTLPAAELAALERWLGLH